MNDEQSDDLAAVRARLAMAVTELKVRRGLTQSHLAARAGISVALVERVEHASPGDIGLDTLYELAKLRERGELLETPRAANWWSMGRSHA